MSPIPFQISDLKFQIPLRPPASHQQMPPVATGELEFARFLIAATPPAPRECSAFSPLRHLLILAATPPPEARKTQAPPRQTPKLLAPAPLHNTARANRRIGVCTFPDRGCAACTAGMLRILDGKA